MEDEKLRATMVFKRRGGNCPNTLEVLQQLLDFGTHDTISLALCAVLPSRVSPGTQHVRVSLGPAVNLELLAIFLEARLPILEQLSTTMDYQK